MEIYLVRHTTPDVEKGICYGQSDLSLVNGFSDEVDDLRKKLPMDFDAIYSSPLSRCIQLAHSLEGIIVSDERLMEMNFGDWEMRNWNELPQTELNAWMSDFVNVKVPNGESFRELISRVEGFLTEVLKSNMTKVCIVSHAGVIRAILGHFLELDPKDFFKLNIDYGGLSLVKITNGVANLKFVNR